MGIRRADHATPLYPQKLALTSPTNGGRSVGRVRSRTKATKLLLLLLLLLLLRFMFVTSQLFEFIQGDEPLPCVL
jgi:hypothetical protein